MRFVQEVNEWYFFVFMILPGFRTVMKLSQVRSCDPRSYERNFCNCVKKPEKFRTSTGFEPVTSRYRCDALPN